MLSMMSWNLMNFQDSMSPIMYYLTFFHEFIMMIILFILMIILYLLLNIILNKFYTSKLIDNHVLETIWTVLPLLVLILLAFPSIKILYMMEDMKDSMLSVKSVGNQWYWSYEYPQFKNLTFDSYMLTEIEENMFRLLDVDNRLVLPFHLKIQMLSTSNDVIHSFALPSLGVKVDSIPGRLNQVFFFSTIPGIFYGQCSEICGLNHSFMPIVVEMISLDYFLKWLKY